MPAEGSLVAGTRVKLQGLKARPELNGKSGTVGQFHRESGRYKVTIDKAEGGDVLALKPATLEVVWAPEQVEDITTDIALKAGLRCRVANLKARPEMNGKFGFCEEYLEESGRWKVKVDGGDFLSLKPENIEPSPDTPFDPNEFIPLWKREGPKTAPDDMNEFLLNPPTPPQSCPKGTSLWLLGRLLDDGHFLILADHLAAGKYKHITYLNMGSNYVTAYGFAACMNAVKSGALPNLEQLAISENSLGDHGAIALAEALHAMPKLVLLEANKCDFGDNGGAVIWAALARGNNRGMESIYLKDQQMADESYEQMCIAYAHGEEGALPKLKHLQLGGNKLSDEGCLVMANHIEEGHLAHVRNLYVGPGAFTKDGTEVVQAVCDEHGYKHLHVFF